MTDDQLHDDVVDAELVRLAAQPLRVHAIDPHTGERVEGVVYGDRLAKAQIDSSATSSAEHVTM